MSTAASEPVSPMPRGRRAASATKSPRMIHDARRLRRARSRPAMVGCGSFQPQLVKRSQGLILGGAQVSFASTFVVVMRGVNELMPRLLAEMPSEAVGAAHRHVT